jgi:uncharacterized protein (DUF433 family)
METLLNRITIDEQICHGKPCVRNMRYPVEMIIDLLSTDMTVEEILEDYPSKLLKVKSIHKLRA